MATPFYAHFLILIWTLEQEAEAAHLLAEGEGCPLDPQKSFLREV